MNYVSALSGKYAITFSAWLLLSPISIFLTVSFTPEGANGTYPAWMALGFIGHALTGVVLLIGWVAIRKLMPGGRKALTVLILFAIAGAIRGFSVGYFGQLMGLIAEPDYLGRIRSGSVLVLVWFSFAAVLIETNADYRLVLRNLRNAAQTSARLAQKSKDFVLDYRNRITEQVKSLLETALINSRNPGELTKVIGLVLEPVINDQRNLNLDVELAEAKTNLNQIRSISLRATVQTIFFRSSFNGSATAFVFLASTASSRLWISRFEIFLLDILINALWIIFAAKLAASATRLLTGVKRFSSVLVSWLVIAFGAGIITESLNAGTFVFTSATVFLFATAVLIVFFLTSALDAYRLLISEKIAELDVVAAQLEWYRRSIHQSLWVEKRRLTRLIHSQVQSRILATAARVARQTPQRTINEHELQELRQVCLAAISSDETETDVRKFLNEISEVFSGATEIKFELFQGVDQILQHDKNTAGATLEIVREGINNAVKHGRANNIFVRIELEHQNLIAEDMIAISVIDDGEPLKASTKPGLGQATLDELSIDWNISQIEGLTVLKARVPLAKFAKI